MELMSRVSELMPDGKPKFETIRYYPTITQLTERVGLPKMHMLLGVLVEDFCRSINVVRNMNEDQMIECAALLLDEAGNFRLEDYVMMFAMAKRGQLGNIFDHLDIQVVGNIVEQYWKMRSLAGQRIQEEQVRATDNEFNERDVTFAPVVSEAMTRWLKELPEEKPVEEKQTFVGVHPSVVAYARLHGLECPACSKPQASCECL